MIDSPAPELELLPAPEATAAAAFAKFWSLFAFAYSRNARARSFVPATVGATVADPNCPFWGKITFVVFPDALLLGPAEPPSRGTIATKPLSCHCELPLNTCV